MQAAITQVCQLIIFLIYPTVEVSIAYFVIFFHSILLAIISVFISLSSTYAYLYVFKHCCSLFYYIIIYFILINIILSLRIVFPDYDDAKKRAYFFYLIYI